jgi:hypothetical protein
LPARIPDGLDRRIAEGDEELIQLPRLLIQLKAARSIPGPSVSIALIA